MRTTLYILLAAISCIAVTIVLDAFGAPIAAIVLTWLLLGLTWAHAIYTDYRANAPYPRNPPLTVNQVEAAVRHDLRGKVSEGRIGRAVAMAACKLRRGSTPDEAYDAAILHAEAVVINEHNDPQTTRAIRQLQPARPSHSAAAA